MGRVNTGACEQMKGLIALNVVGQLPDDERVELLAHLDECRECRDEERELIGLARALPAADTAHLEEDEVPPALAEAVLGHLRSEAKHDRRRRFLLRALAAGAVAAAAAVALLFVLLPGTTNQSVTVALAGTSGVHASVQLTSESWGTSLHIAESGQAGGQVMWVSMHTRSGSWWQAGTYRSVSGHAVEVNLACALKLSQIESIWVRNAAGKTVLHGYLA